jgi:phenylacetic acid degradation protein PaaD
MSFTAVGAEKLLPGDGLGAHLGIRYVDGGADFVIVEITLDERHLNFLGGCHGGVIFALADTAFGLASNSGGNLSVAIDAHVTFIKGARTGDVLRAKAQHVSRSSKTSVYRVDVTRDSDILATFTGTVYITGKNVEDFINQAP